jgi:transposase
MLNSIPEPVDLVGNAFRQVGCALKLALELGHPPGAPRPTSASSRLGRTCAPAGSAIGARPVGSCAASASTGVMRHQSAPSQWETAAREEVVVDDEYRIYVGIDWATEAHRACVLDSTGRVLAERSFAHTGEAVAAFAQWLHGFAGDDPGHAAIALEIPRGAVVETLVEHGFHLYAINPKQLDRFRDRHSVAGAKDDRRDAFVLSDSLRGDRARFRRIRLDDPLVIQLRELSRVDEELGRETNRLTNRLREQLYRFYVQALKLCPSADEPWLWALLEIAPAPAAAGRLPRKSIERLLRQHRIRRLSAQDVIAALRAPALHVAPGVVEAATEHIALLLPRLCLVHTQRQRCGARLEALLDKLAAVEGEEGQQREHRDVEILRSLPGVGRVVAATVLAEASGPLAERDYHALRAHAGIAPVTKQSGKRRTVVMRYACNGRLRYALYHWARVAVTCDPASKTYYTALRQRGHPYARALRSVADRLLRILIAMLKSGSLFDSTRLRLAADAAVTQEAP